MNAVQEKLAVLQRKGWTLAAIADEVGVTYNAVVKWKAGDRTPSNEKLLLEHLDRLFEQKQVPKQRRYHKGMRSGGTTG